MFARLKNMDRRLATILLIVFVQFVGASMVLPILPLYAKRAFAMEPQVITLLVSVFFAAQFVAGPYIGRLSDQYGRIPVLVISQIGTVISFLMLGVAQSITVLFLSRILDGITGGNIIVAQAYVTDIFPREERTQALGLVFAMFGLGFIVGPALGGVLSAAFGARVPFLIAAIAAAITVALTWIVLDETVTAEQREARRSHQTPSLGPAGVISNWPLVLVLIVAFVGQFGLGLIQSTFALLGEAVLFTAYDESLTNLGVGLLLAVIGLGQFFTQIFLLRRMLRTYNEPMIVIIGAVSRGLAMFGFAVITSPFLGVPLALMMAIGGGLMMPPVQSLATTTVSDDQRGNVLGWYQSATSLSTIFSTALGGTLFAISPQTPYWLGGTLFILSIIPTYVLQRLVRSGRLDSPSEPKDETAAPAAATD